MASRNATCADRALAAKRATHELGRILLARLGHDPYGYDHLKRKPIRELWPMLYRGSLEVSLMGDPFLRR